MKRYRSRNTLTGFTLLEILAVVGIIAILGAIIIGSIQAGRNKSLFAKAEKDLDTMATALQFYAADNRGYPDDVERDLPSGLEEYLPGGELPEATWPGSVYDWDNWEDPEDSSKRIYQISIRFCPIGGPLSACNFPNDEWAENFDLQSAVYFCVQGACRSHINKPIDHPGYCINC